MTRSIQLRVPASTANLGPGYDSLGMALSLYLTVSATLSHASANDSPTTPSISLTYTGAEPGAISLDPSKNLISRTLLDTLRAAHTSLPANSVLSIHIDNPIPLGRGLGSSGSAVVAGVVLANWAAQLGWSRDKLLQHCVAIEGHPDNVAPSLLGGFVASVMSGSGPTAAQDADHEPPVYTLQLPFAKDKIKLVAVVPAYHTPTDLARAALPKAYAVGQVVHTVQRAVMLTHVLGNPNVHGKGTHLTKQALGCLLDDVLHQPYRMHLIPGFQQLKSALNTNPDVLGLCVSGAGPTVLIFCTLDVDVPQLTSSIEVEYAKLPHPEHPGKVGIDVLVLPIECAEEGSQWTES
ncbi:ribosomal protein S5 domain 2-type protein [Catenaria anguillulae PL171]|uniref:Homoserine kinase n=1 Tax=Catenaria anguillulae PL171 TaxID=765915 RepID=A0A1Y2HQM8_9FUNG|nr:ribosomal protein S5 domain 2-type protein [Catenaria anguillulae PL171]